MKRRNFIRGLALSATFVGPYAFAWTDPLREPRKRPKRIWEMDWPDTDFSKFSIDYREIKEAGLGRDSIPPIDKPRFRRARDYRKLNQRIHKSEPVISLVINGDARAYPLAIMMFHEIVNDTVGGVPVAVTYCPLCNAAIVFERTVNGKRLSFGTTGMLRKSDMVMYDRLTDSWWQQFVGLAIVGRMTGTKLIQVPARLESFKHFLDRHPEGRLLVPNGPSDKPYGRNAYPGYDSARRPWMYDGRYRGPVPALSRVVMVGDQAWSIGLIREMGSIEQDGMIISWTKGQNSALDKSKISKGRDVGNITVQRRAAGGSMVDVIHQVPFAFAYMAFFPGGTIITEMN